MAIVVGICVAIVCHAIGSSKLTDQVICSALIVITSVVAYFQGCCDERKNNRP